MGQIIEIGAKTSRHHNYAVAGTLPPEDAQSELHGEE